MFLYKIHKVEKETVLAVCDSEIIGKVFREGKLKLEIKTSFYYEKKANKTEILKLFEKADIINISGKKIVALALREKYIEKNKIITIDGVPHAQIIKM